VSGTFVHIPNWGNILLDAGEGTWGQLCRQYGDDVWQVLRDLKCIFVSHMHGDHHIGVPKILAMRNQVFSKFVVLRNVLIKSSLTRLR
jgi:ribonuclease Z